MIAIRGATTVENDCKEDIKLAVDELLTQIKERNDLDTDKIVCLMFSNTSDLKSFYPAKAARESGFYSCALFSAAEPEIEGSLKKCIRVMVLAEVDKRPVHVYLNGAANLRSDVTSTLNISLDGPAGSGKSTVAKIVAKKLKINYLDTAAMYRACALKCVKAGISVGNEDCVKKIMENLDLKVRYKDGVQITLLDGKDVADDIRKPEISMLASTVSAHKCVREKMVALQRDIASAYSCVLDGRDIGTNVLPDTKYKFFLTASSEVRAKRRYSEQLLKGYNLSFDEVLREINERDEQDKTRKIAPLLKAEDALLIDTSEMSPDEVADTIIRKVQEKV